MEVYIVFGASGKKVSKIGGGNCVFLVKAYAKGTATRMNNDSYYKDKPYTVKTFLLTEVLDG